MGRLTVFSALRVDMHLLRKWLVKFENRRLSMSIGREHFSKCVPHLELPVYCTAETDTLRIQAAVFQCVLSYRRTCIKALVIW